MGRTLAAQAPPNAPSISPQVVQAKEKTMPTKGMRVDDGAEWADDDGEKGPNNAGERDKKGRSPT